MTISPFYSVEVIDPTGLTVDTIDNPISLVAARSYTNPGSAVLTLLPNYDEEFFRYNMRFKLWRTDAKHGKALFGDTVWFLRKFTHQVSQDRFVVEMNDALILLSNPIVAYTAQTPYADKTLEELGDITYDDYYRIDNLMKAYVRENLGPDALDSARINPYIVVEQNLNLAPHGEKTASWAKLNGVLSDLARMSAEKGMELFYDLIPQSNNTFLFKVWRDIRGADRGFLSSASLIFSDENGDLDDVQVVYDYSQMATYCYVLGYDTGPSQVIVEVGNSAIIESDPFGRIEFTTNSNDNDVASVLQADGQAALYALRPRRVLSARLSAASSLRYGTDFAYGDRVGVQVGGRRYDCQISAVKADWQEAREVLDIRLDGSESLWNPTYWEGSDRTPAPVVVPTPSYELPDSGPFAPPPFGDDSIFYGDMQGYVLWDGAHVYRTQNLMADFPTWQLIDTGVTGSIQDCQYVNVDADTIGAWLMTYDGIWWCADVQASIPTWTNVLPIATIRAADEVPATGDVVCKTMFHYWSAPGHLCVATGPMAANGDNTTYLHAYFWVTENYGVDWTQVDMNYFTFTNSATTRCYCNSSLYAMNVYRSSPGTIYCVRSAPIVGGQGGERVFISRDLGYTWEEGMSTAIDTRNNPQIFSMLHPFPDVDDPSYMVSGALGVSDRPDLRVSTDEWATHTVLTANGTPSNYGGLSNLWRVNKRTFDNLHVLAWFRDNADTFYDLLESNDAGATWSLLLASGLSDQTIPNVGTGGSAGNAVSCARFNTPNGWPPDVDQWVVVRAIAASATSFANVIRLTLDNFATTLDKVGNLPTLVSGWTDGPADGFALPKVGVNTETPSAGIQLRVARGSASFSAPTVSVSSTGVVEGDTVVLHLRTDEDVAPSALPSGFTLVPGSEITGVNTIRVYEKVAGASEPATYDFTFPSGNARVGLIAIYPAAGTISVDVVANQTNASSGTPSAPSVTATVRDTFLMNFFSLNSARTVTPQSGMVQSYDSSGSSTIAAQTQTVAAPGATGTRTMTLSVSTTTKAVTIAWKEM